VRRLLVAFALAIALHAILALLLPALRPPNSAGREFIAHVTIARIEPRPRPTPTPKPKPVRTFAAVPARSPAPLHREPVHHAGAPHVRPPRLALTPEPAPAATAGQGAGAGAGAGAGSLGSASAPGNGGGGEQPCGVVTFSDPHGSRYDPKTGGFYVDIRLSVDFPDGHAESVLLDYPFYYATASENPWSEQNLADPDFPTRFQTPPPALAAQEPPLVRYVIAHSNPNGTTMLQECPTP